MLAVGLTLWGGVAIGGVRRTVDPGSKKLWFMAQVCCGGYTLGAYGLGEWSRRGLVASKIPGAESADPRSPEYARIEHKLLATSRWKATEVAWVYTGVAGLLNILVILDAMARAESAATGRDPRGAGSGKTATAGAT